MHGETASGRERNMHELSEDLRSGPREMNLKGTLLCATIAVVDAEVIDLRGTEEPMEPFRDVNQYYKFSLSFSSSYDARSRVRLFLSDDIATPLQGRQSDKYMDMPSRKWMVNL